MVGHGGVGCMRYGCATIACDGTTPSHTMHILPSWVGCGGMGGIHSGWDMDMDTSADEDRTVDRIGVVDVV